MKKVLILNSDSPNNRGDRAILLGNIALIREVWPEADIWALSEFPERDADWFGVNFIEMPVFSLNPFSVVRLSFLSRGFDVVLWGGGEFLKDYTNILGTFYWAIRIFLLRLGNKNIYGFFQGIGPTQSWLAKRVIVWVVNRTKAFLVRDDESKEKLQAWGVRVPLASSFDPAAVAPLQPMKNELVAQLAEQGVSAAVFDNCVGVGIRNWFHYSKGAWLPFRLKKRFGWDVLSEESVAYCDSMAGLCDYVVDQFGCDVVFFPMHMLGAEGDDAFCHRVKEGMKNSGRAIVLDEDVFSPQDLQSMVGMCRAMICTRLHASIIAYSSHVPSLSFYYVDKGRIFFEQVQMQDYSRPIECLAQAGGIGELKSMVDTLFRNEVKLRKAIANSRERLNSDITSAARVFLGNCDG